MKDKTKSAVINVKKSKEKKREEMEMERLMALAAKQKAGESARKEAPATSVSASSEGGKLSQGGWSTPLTKTLPNQEEGTNAQSTKDANRKDGLSGGGWAQSFQQAPPSNCTSDERQIAPKSGGGWTSNNGNSSDGWAKPSPAQLQKEPTDQGSLTTSSPQTLQKPKLKFSFNLKK
jgi:hypothetical protein